MSQVGNQRVIIKDNNKIKIPKYKKYKFTVPFKKFILDNAEAIIKNTLRTHHTFNIEGDDAQKKIKLLQRKCLDILESIAHNLNPSKSSSDSIAEQSKKIINSIIKGNITSEEIGYVLILLKQILWEKLRNSNLLDKISKDDAVRLSLIIDNHFSIISSLVSSAYYQYYRAQSMRGESERSVFEKTLKIKIEQQEIVSDSRFS